MKRSRLVNTLEGAGKSPETWESTDGTTVLVLPYGGRILGLFAPGDEDNFFWTHPALDEAESARGFYEGAHWHNSGGDRTWLAPEVDFFFPDYPQLSKYWQQRELDPGHYEVSRNNGSLTLVNRATLVLSRPKQKVELEITKSLATALNPLRYDSDDEMVGLKYAGYTLRTTLQPTASNSEELPQVGLWNLVQMPHGGDMLVPTFSRSEPKVYMGTIGPQDLTISEHLIRYKMRASGEHKLGVRAIATTGRVGYAHTLGNEAALVIRNFAVNPSGEYVDVPWIEADNFGFVFQACNVNSALGAFSELEYHVPAIGLRTGRSRCEGESQLWAFRGPEQMIRAVARRLLSPEA